MNLPLFIAGRYLFARKSHNVINIISAISAAGMAIGTAVLITILSIYNGFDALICDNLSDVDPDVLVTPSRGKVFSPEGEAFAWAGGQSIVANASAFLEDNVFISYDSRQCLAVARGVDEAFEQDPPLLQHVRSGEFRLHHGERALCAVGSGLAYEMGINPHFVAPVEIYYPMRDRAISLANPAASLECVSASPSCTVAISSEKDATLLILPLDAMRELLGYETEVSGVEIRLRPDASAKETKAFISELRQKLGDGFKVSDRFQQNEALYKMMRYEKAAIFLILIFIIIIIAFNIFGSLSMLIIEKEGDIETLRCLGATPSLVNRIFILEGWLISLLGLAAGLILGVGFSLLQQHFGIIALPGSYLVDAYPVQIKWGDVAATAAFVALIGYLIALLPILRRKQR